MCENNYRHPPTLPFPSMSPIAANTIPNSNQCERDVELATITKQRHNKTYFTPTHLHSPAEDHDAAVITTPDRLYLLFTKRLLRQGFGRVVVHPLPNRAEVIGVTSV